MDKIEILNLLTEEISTTQIFIDEPMKKHTSFKIGGDADVFIKVRKMEELKYAIDVALKNNINITIVGNGTNLLVKDKGIRGFVIKLEFNHVKMEKINEEEYLVRVGSGVKLSGLAQILLQEELTGFEFASGIPGTIGGAVRMNAGAYGGEMKDIVLQTKCLNLEEYKNKVITSDVDKKITIETLDNTQQQFTYRNSIFNNKKYIILETVLKLHKGNKEEIQAKMDEYLASRKEKQPIGIPNAGSTFKRGEDFITAKLIDECGLKGYSVGDAEVSTKHAGFIVNKGEATANDVLKLTKYVQKTVYEKTGKKIELEIEILGE